MDGDAAFGAIPLEVVTHQHDLMLDVIREIHELVAPRDTAAAGDGKGDDRGERRSAFFSRVALLAEFLVEHTYIEQTQFLPAVRVRVERAGRTELVAKLEQIEERIAQLGDYAERVLNLCCEPSPTRVEAAGGLTALMRFVYVAERMIRREDEVVVPFVERLIGCKSRRLTRLDVALAEAQAANKNHHHTTTATTKTTSTTEEEPPTTHRGIASSA